MRYHLFKVSKSRNLIIADSQARELDIANFNVLSLPGARVRHVYNFVPKKGDYDIVVLFIGGNDLFCGNIPSTLSADDLVQEISDLANLLLTKAKKVFVLGIPQRHSQSQRTKAVNALLASRREGWKFRGIARQVYSDKHLKGDKVHLNSNALSGISYILKSKVLYENYCPELENEGHSVVIQCCGTCKCLSWTRKL